METGTGRSTEDAADAAGADGAERTEAPGGSRHDRFANRDQLRALAHPLRLDIMERVGRRGTARAADLAADLGIPANSVSYHLRILARGGVIEEAPEAARDRRDRVWRLAQEPSGFDPIRLRVLNDPDQTDQDYRAASGATAMAAFDWIRSAFQAEIARATAPEVAPEEGLGQMVTTSLRLSREQMKELSALMIATVDEYWQINRDAHGTDLPGDPDSEGEALTFRTMWVIAGEPSAAPGATASRGTEHPADG